MNILIALHGAFPVSYYGGTQRVVWGLGKTLFEMGHQVTFLVDSIQGDCPFATLIARNPDKSLYEQIPPETDLVHFNEFEVEAAQMPCPYVITIHGNKVPRQLDPNVIFVSRNHAQRNGCESYVYNGIDWDTIGNVDLQRQRQHYHFLGKAAWRVKNVRGAIDVVKGIPGADIDILGGNRLNFKMGFRLTITPSAHFHGLVDDQAKYEVMLRSRGLVFPVIWHEPFGLAIIESLYAGCPVFGTPYGSLPELISQQPFGFLTTSATEMREAILAHTPSPQLCHEYARTSFSARAMTLAYLDKYEKVMNGERLTTHFGNRQESWCNLEWKK